MTSGDAEFIQLVTTIDSAEHAKCLARLIVERKLGACVQVLGPITSLFRWQGQIEEATEWGCVVKTLAAHYPALEELIKQNHPYEVPEILVLPVQDGNRAYLDWWRAECTS